MHKLINMLSLSLLVVALVAGPALPSPADSWLGTRHCTVGERCRSESTTYGTPGTYPDHYVRHHHNDTLSTAWQMYSTPHTHTFTAETGTVDVFIYTTDNLTSQSAYCVCISPPCPDRAG